MGDPSSETVGQRLREARRARGLTQQQVADHLGVWRRAVSEWETGLRKPHVAIPDLAALYGVSPSFLLYGVEPSSAELRAVHDDVTVLLFEVKTVRADLVTLAESTAEALRQLRVLVETLAGAGPVDGLRLDRGRENEERLLDEP